MSEVASIDNISLNSAKSSKSNRSKDFGNEVIEEVKRRFLDEYEANKDLYDEEDIERIITNDFFVRRFVNFNGQGPEKGFEQMKKAYRWRKSFGVNHYDQLLIPKQ
ncbi:motile sperm domain-containing protein 2-like protein, partial [Leptotrombidium deliense]